LIDYNLYINNLDTMERQSLPNQIALRANNGQYVRVRRNDNVLVADFAAQPPSVSTSIFFEIVNVR
jgi:hypothetical protein